MRDLSAATSPITLKRLVNPWSKADMIDKTLARMIDEALRDRGDSSLSRANCLKSR
jgi:hypothetical protein